jgi:hypothetical protein
MVATYREHSQTPLMLWGAQIAESARWAGISVTDLSARILPGSACVAPSGPGRSPWRPDAGAEALRQRALRYSGAVAVADVFLGAGFDVVISGRVASVRLRKVGP